ncbi:MAG: hypothetical protein WCX46_03030 [Candidatus Paceibacterota bacterium]
MNEKIKKEIDTLLKESIKNIFNSSNLEKEIDYYFEQMEIGLVKIIQDHKDEKSALIVEVLKKMCDSTIPDIYFRKKIIHFLLLLEDYGKEGYPLKIDDFLPKIY